MPNENQHIDKHSIKADGQAAYSPSTKDTQRKSKQSLSMHDGIAVWCDCCSCEAEPYWAALAEEFGMDLSDYEETKS